MIWENYSSKILQYQKLRYTVDTNGGHYYILWKPNCLKTDTENVLHNCLQYVR